MTRLLASITDPHHPLHREAGRRVPANKRGMDESHEPRREDTRWHYVTLSTAMVGMESKFITGAATITRKQLEAEWPGWTQQERHDFVLAFTCSTLPEAQPDVLDYLLEQAEETPADEIRVFLSTLFPRHPDRDRVFNLLRRWHEADPRLASQGLGLLGDSRAIPLLEDQLRKALAKPDLQEEGDFFNDSAGEAIAALSSLIRLQPERQELVTKLQSFQQHANALVRQHALAVLGQVRPDLAPIRRLNPE